MFFQQSQGYMNSSSQATLTRRGVSGPGPENSSLPLGPLPGFSPFVTHGASLGATRTPNMLSQQGRQAAGCLRGLLPVSCPACPAEQPSQATLLHAWSSPGRCARLCVPIAQTVKPGQGSSDIIIDGPRAEPAWNRRFLVPIRSPPACLAPNILPGATGCCGPLPASLTSTSCARIRQSSFPSLRKTLMKQREEKTKNNLISQGS